MLYDEFVNLVRKSYCGWAVKDGIFGAMMNVKLENDGPVTIILDSSRKYIDEGDLFGDSDEEDRGELKD